jgi:hypothetical protein
LWQESQRIGEVLKSTVAGAKGKTLHYVLPEIVRHKIDVPDLTAQLVAAAREDPAFRIIAAELLVRRGKIPVEAVPLLADAAREGFNFSPASRAKILRGLWRGTPGEEGTKAALGVLAQWGDPAKMAPELAGVWREFTTDFGHAKKYAVFAKAAEGDDAGQRALAYLVLLNLRANKKVTKQLMDGVTIIVDRALSDPKRAVGMLKAIGATRSDDYRGRVLGLLKSDRSEIPKAAADTAKLLGLDQGRRQGACLRRGRGQGERSQG